MNSKCEERVIQPFASPLLPKCTATRSGNHAAEQAIHTRNPTHRTPRTMKGGRSVLITLLLTPMRGARPRI